MLSLFPSPFPTLDPLLIDFYWFWNAGLAGNFTMDVVHDVIDGEQRRMGSVKVFDPSLYLI